MKKLLIIFTLLTLAFVGNTHAQANGMTVAEIDAWLAPNPAPYNVATSNDYKYAHFQTKAHIDRYVRGGVNVVVPVVSFVCNTSQMDIKIPRGLAKGRGWPDDQDFTLRQFTQKSKDLDKNKTVVAASACDYRTDGTITRISNLTSDGVDLWDKGIAPYISFDDLLNIAEAKQYWSEEEGEE